MKKEKKVALLRTCDECIHEYACKSWTCGRVLADENASRCPAFETVKDSAAYFIGKIDGGKAAQPKWISVEDRLPTKDDASAGGLVLCICCDENGKPMMKEMHAWHWSVVKDFHDCFTRWMPLPEPPKEGNK